MLKYDWNVNKEAIAGNPGPHITTDFNNNIWFMWRNFRYQQGVPLVPEGKPMQGNNQIVIAKYNRGFVETKVTYDLNEDSVQLKSLCATSRGPVGFWTGSRKNAGCLYAGIYGGKPTTISFSDTIWDAKAVNLANGQILLGIIFLETIGSTLRFYQFNPETASLSLCRGLTDANIWSLSLVKAKDSDRVWVAYDKFEGHRFKVYGGYFHPEQGISKIFVMPSTGYATEPHVSLLDSDGACVVWRQEKDWGKKVYDFTRDTQLKMAFIGETGVKSSQLVPVPLPEEVDGQKLPSSPVAIQSGEGIRVFFRYFRTEIGREYNPEYGLMVNDWGYQLMEMLLDNKGEWHEPAIVSLDVSYVDEPIQAAFAGNQLYAIYHSCSFDSQRECNHSERINIAVSNGTQKTPVQKGVSAYDFQIYPQTVLTQTLSVTYNNSLFNCYWGDIHRHSVISKCIPEHDGSYKDHIKYAIASRGFDFYAITDHDSQITPREWTDYLNLMDRVSLDGKFVTLYGFEGPLGSIRGHLNLYFTDWESAQYGFNVLRRINDFSRICRQIKQDGFIDRIYSIRHFHADKLPYKEIYVSKSALFDPKLDIAMEIVQGRGFSPKTINELLDQGLRFGFVGGTDHNRPPGHPRGGIGIYEQAITGLWAGELNRAEIFGAIKSRQTFGTNGPRLGVWIKVNHVFMGGIAANCQCNEIEIMVYPTTRILAVNIIKDGNVIKTIEDSCAEPKMYRFTDQHSDGAASYYYAEILQENEEGQDYKGRAWTSPVWLVTTDPGKEESR